MNVLLTHRPGGAYGYISDGWYNALRDKGHKVQRWDETVSTWRSFDPCLYIGCSGHKQPIPPKGRCKIAIHVNPYGPVDIGGINESQENIRWTLRQHPDAVFGYGQEQDRMLWSYWTTKHNIQWVPMPTAGDRTIYKKLDCNKSIGLVYVGGRWEYKAKSIDAYLLPALEKCDYEVRGWGGWPANVNHKQIADDEVCKFLNSGKVGPCISEPHTHSYGIDIPERAFKVALCGTLAIHDCVSTIKTMIPSMIVAQNPSMFSELCEYYIKNEAEREEIAERQRQEVLKSNTYHHRIAALLSKLGFIAEATEMLN